MNLEQFSQSGKYLMLALDHRGSFLKMMGNDDAAAATQLKKQIIEAVINQASGVLIDQDYGLPAYSGFDKPFLLPLEKSGFNDEAGERLTELMYSAEQLVGEGAGGAKLLLYMNPEAKTVPQQVATAKQALADCRAHKLPLFLEIVTYPDEGNRAERILGSLKSLITAGVVPEVWKLEYPGSAEACRQVSEKVGQTPWILLTRGESFEPFADQLREATQAGAVGFLAGRALWQEVFQLKGAAKDQFLAETLPQRFKQICEIASQ